MNAFLITNICAVTPEKTLEKAVIWVEDGRIKQVCEKSELPSTANVLPKIDGKNTFALPGFIDLHIHGFAGFGVETGNAQDLLAMSAIKNGDIDTARSIYENVLKIEDLPEGFKAKIQDMLSSISDM